MHLDFYSRPCGRGDAYLAGRQVKSKSISTHAPAGGATDAVIAATAAGVLFLLTPLREGRLMSPRKNWDTVPFLLTPLREGRLALRILPSTALIFLLTPLREGRLSSTNSA